MTGFTWYLEDQLNTGALAVQQGIFSRYVHDVCQPISD